MHSAAEHIEALADRHWELNEFHEQVAAAAAERDRAVASNEAKSRFLATVSHEFRTPLSGILGLTAILLETELSAEQESFVRAARSSSELLLGLVDDMLDLAKIEAGRLDLRDEPTSVEALAQDVVELLASRAHAKGLDFALRTGPGVPPLVAVDGARLRQVLINLAGNAIKFTETGGVAVSITAAPRGSGHHAVTVRVEDTGPGFAADEGASRPGPPAAAAPRGSGLGLSITRSLLAAMGGDLAIRRREEGGSEVGFALDLAALPAPAAEPLGPGLAARRGLVLAPRGMEADAAAALLAAEGAEVTVTAIPFQAAALAGAADAAGLGFDFVLVDARSDPDPGGALARIRAAAGRLLHAAVLIEPASRRKVEAFRAAGFDAYLVRPIRRSSLIRIAARLAGGPDGFGVDPGDDKPARPPAVRAPQALSVLLVEDDEINALLVRAVLERLGHRVSEFHDGRAAVRAAAAERFDVVLMDLHLPGMDGFTAANAIRAAERESGRDPVRLIAISADPTEAARADAAAAGFDLYLGKPIDPETLRATLARLTGAAAA